MLPAQQLYPAQSTLAQIRRDRLVTHIRLYRARGGGWSLPDAPWTDQETHRWLRVICKSIPRNSRAAAVS